MGWGYFSLEFAFVQVGFDVHGHTALAVCRFGAARRPPPTFLEMTRCAHRCTWPLSPYLFHALFANSNRVVLKRFGQHMKAFTLKVKARPNLNFFSIL